MSKVLAVLEQREGALRKVSSEVVTGARRLADGLAGRVDALVRRLDAREFGVAEVQDDDRSLGPRFVDALRRNYRVDHESQWGVFWVPR